MVELLTRREWKVDVKTDVAVRRLEKESDQLQDEEHEVSLTEAFADRTKVLKLVVDKWLADKGFGFGKAQSGEVVFIHASAEQGAEVLMIGTDAWVQVVNDDARAQGLSSTKGLGMQRVEGRDGQGEGKQSGRASEARSGADDRAGPRPMATVSPFFANGSPLPAGQGFFAPRFRGVKRASRTKPMGDQVLDVRDKATGKDEDQVRQKFEKMRPNELQRSLEHWRTRAEETQRFRSRKRTRGSSTEASRAPRSRTEKTLIGSC